MVLERGAQRRPLLAVDEAEAAREQVRVRGARRRQLLGRQANVVHVSSLCRLLGSREVGDVGPRCTSDAYYMDARRCGARTIMASPAIRTALGGGDAGKNGAMRILTTLSPNPSLTG